MLLFFFLPKVLKLSFRGDTAASADFFPFLCLPMDMHCKADPFSAMHREYWSPAPSAALPFSFLHSSSPTILPHLILLQVHPFPASLFSPGRNRAQRDVQKAGRVSPALEVERGSRAAPGPGEHSSVPAAWRGPAPPARGAEGCLRLCLCHLPSACERKQPPKQISPPRRHFPHCPSDKTSLLRLVSPPELDPGPGPGPAPPGQGFLPPCVALSPKFPPAICCSLL